MNEGLSAPVRDDQARDCSSLLLDAALGYVERGWRVFPLGVRSKQPLFESAHPEGDPLRGVCHGECGKLGHGFYDATDSLDRVKQWWTDAPLANIGIALEASGLALIDVDPQNGGNYAELERAVDLGSPIISHTGRKGVHLLYGDTGVPLRSNLNHAALYGIDVKRLGYIVAPPSIHPNGTAYQWDDDEHLEVVPMPSMVLDTCRAPEREEREYVGRTDANLDARERAYRDAMLDGVCERIANARDGERHDAQFSGACQLGEAVGGGWLERSIAEQRLEEACTKLYGAPPNRSDLRDIRDGLDRGARNPRDIPDEYDRERKLLLRIAASDVPADIADLYYENNPEILRRCAASDDLEEQYVAAVVRFDELLGKEAADRFIQQIKHA